MSLYRGDETSGTGTSVEDLISGKVNRTGDTMTGALTATDITATGHLIGLTAEIGNMGSEGSGINIGGVTYESSFKVSDIDGTNYAQTILHRHSTTLEPLIVGARSNSNIATHTDVTNSQNLFTTYAAGWAGSNYKLFGSQSFGVASTGTVSNTSAPGAYSLKLTPDGSTTLAEVMSVSNTSNLGISYVNSKRPFNYPININGNFQIAQAGTSFAVPANGAYDLDGWLNGNTSAAVFTVAQATGSSAEKLCRQVTITTADSSIAAGDTCHDITRIEGYDITKLVGNTFTVSFKAKYPLTGIHCISVKNQAADRSYVHAINVLTANTWANYSFTITGGLPTAGTWSYTNTSGLQIHFSHATGSTYQTASTDTWLTGNYSATANQENDCATIGNVWALEDVRIDLGTVVGTDWPSYQENLARCQRYYENSYKYGVAPGTSIGNVGFIANENILKMISLNGGVANRHNGSVNFKVKKRNATGTLRIWDTAGTLGAYTGVDNNGGFVAAGLTSSIVNGVSEDGINGSTNYGSIYYGSLFMWEYSCRL